MPETISFCGEDFTLVEVMGAMAWMEYADAAQRGVDSDSMEGLALIFDLLKAAIVDEQWARFRQVARDNRVDNDGIWAVMKDVIEVASARPTSRPSDSSDGPQTPSTPQRSEDDAYLRVKRRFEAEGRPSWALMAMQAHEARTA